jgi:uncharacterized iron-regulated membrane protein
MSITRQFWVIAHRWAGLTIAFFLIVAAITGTFLAFNKELLYATQPWRSVTPPNPAAKLLDPITLNNRAMQQLPPGYAINGLQLNIQPGEVLEIGLEHSDADTHPYLEMAVNPYTGNVVKIYEWGKISDGFDQIMPFIYQLHYKLALGEIGLWAFGIAALIWTIDCFVGFYLTLPRVRLRGWGKAWKVRTKASAYKINFDLHRAGGLWLWPILLVFAWSSVGMNLREVYDPVMRAFGATNPMEQLPNQPAASSYKPNFVKAYTTAKQLVRAQNIQIAREGSIYFDTEKNLYSYYFAHPQDFVDTGAWSSLSFYPDAKLALTILADGGLDQGGADNWFSALHMAKVGGLPYRIFVSSLGLLITMLSVTGIIIWMRKRSARIAYDQKEKTERSDFYTLAPAE